MTRLALVVLLLALALSGCGPHQPLHQWYMECWRQVDGPGACL
jgi:hypothetical protein